MLIRASCGTWPQRHGGPWSSSTHRSCLMFTQTLWKDLLGRFPLIEMASSPVLEFLSTTSCNHIFQQVLRSYCWGLNQSLQACESSFYVFASISIFLCCFHIIFVSSNTALLFFTFTGAFLLGPVPSNHDFLSLIWNGSVCPSLSASLLASTRWLAVFSRHTVSTIWHAAEH